ncbi:SH3 domain-containing protein [Gottfriedia sp. NPDC056225]|uniref:SH3 domain-containing protein n=1 Tax=Gottfriedia sp. NPDC056225 TaxID=3345751 RepID=UPI0035E26E16
MKKMGRAILVSTGILVGTTSISCPNIGMEVSKASAAVVNIKTKYQTTANLNLRQGAGTTYKTLLTIPKGKIITATQRNGNWYKVTYSSKTGWVSGTYLKEYYKYNAQSTAYYFTNKTTKLYPTADTKKAAVYTVVANNGFSSTQNVVNSVGKTWFRVSYNGKTLYVNSADVTKNVVATFAQTKYKAIKSTSLYQTYGVSSKVLTSIPSGTIISSTKRIGNWYYVTLNGKTGYVYINNFSKVNEIKYETTSTAYYFTKSVTNLYATPDPAKPVVVTVNGDNGFASTQKATDVAGKIWYQVNYNGQNLYVKSEDVTASSFTTFTATNYKALNSTYLFESFGDASKQVTQIPKDTVISINKKIGNWYSVTYKGTPGYVKVTDFGKYETPLVDDTNKVTVTDITDTTYITTSDLNLRQTHDASSSLLTVVPVNIVLIATDKASNNWYKVSYNGKTGYVSGSFIEQVKTGDPMTSRDSYQFIDLRTPSPVTAAQINNYVASNVKSGAKSILTGQGQLFVDAGKKYGVNALYLAAHAIHESGFGTSQISLGKNNLFGFGSYDITPFVASYKFMSVQENVEYIARSIKSTYLNPTNWKYNGPYLGFSTKDMSNKRIDAASEGMNFYYATDPNWGKLIAQHMQKILPFDKAYYDKAQPNTVIPGNPPTPVGSDVFPVNIQAVAKGNIDLYNAKGDVTKVKSITAGTAFLLLEKTNDYWVKLSIDGNVYWTSSIKFNSYTQTLSVKNLGRITGDVNIRSSATTTENNIIAVLPLNKYVSIVTKTDGTLTMDSTKKWYKIQLENGSYGWVSSSYVKQELK